MGTSPTENTGLGSLAQSARSKQLRQAKGVLIAIGVLTIIVNAIFMAILPGQVKNELDNEVAKAKAQGMVVDQVKVKEAEALALRFGYLTTGVTICLGAIFIGLGLVVYRYPVPATLLGLVLYIGAAIVFGIISPETIVQGFIIKIIIIVGLVKALQAAIAYQKEQRQAADPEAGA